MNAPLSHTMPSSYQYQASRHCLLLLLIPINSDTIHHPTPSPSFSSFVLNEWFVMHMFVITGTSVAFVVIIDDWTSHMCVHNGFVPFITAKGIPYNFRTFTILHLWQQPMRTFLCFNTRRLSHLPWMCSIGTKKYLRQNHRPYFQL